MEKEDRLSVAYRLVYKTSRISYILNYVIAFFMISLVAIAFPSLEFNDFLSIIFVFICFGFAFLLFIEPDIERVLRQYIITDTEVVKVEGILRKKKIAIPMQKIADINLKKGILGRIFNFGNIKISGFKNKIEMKGIRYPEKVYEFVKERVKIKNKLEN